MVVVVLALVGVIAYGVMGGFSGAPGTNCAPAAAPECSIFIDTHDITLIVPYQSVQSGSPVPVTASLPSSESTSGYTFNFGRS